VINRMTHEFRTPLTIIKAGVDMLGKDDSYSELVTLFSESEARLEDLINSLLSLSQKGAKEDEGTTTIDALAVLHDAIHRCSTAAREKGIQFEVAQNVGSPPPVLHMDVADFRTILDALLENAIKFSPAKATVSVQVERGSGPPVVERDGLQLPDWKEQTEDLIREYRDMVPHDRAADPTAEKSPSIGQGEFLVVRISDNGIGIPEQDLASVAEPFRQASNSPDLGVKGKGLGLALAHKVVSRHGGRLCCKSVEGRGTTFSVHLPIEGDSGL
jgi:two-component system phosphate regulon sensor histidine kinase PhoR